jgi:hypothetical protein
MDRVDLHCLVDTLPEGAFENAKRMLEHLQVFPQSGRPRWNVCGRYAWNKWRRCGNQSGLGQWVVVVAVGVSTRPLDTAILGIHIGKTKTVVHETHHFFKGPEIAAMERIRLTEDGRAIHYVHETKGRRAIPL